MKLTAIEPLIQVSLDYLDSEQAARSLAADPYWPKWDSPWWHMALLHEMGVVARVSPRAVHQMAEAVKRQYLPVFFRSEVPEGRDPVRDAPCPCQLGNIYQILSAAGADMDEVLPWARAWFLRYQMPDGGMSCDEAAYRSTPPASSIVGTIAPLEAILYYAKRPLSEDEIRFLDRGAQCLLDRELRKGCMVKYNAEERLDEEEWLSLCFPRLYLYDVLRGLRFVLRWSETLRRKVPARAVREVVAHLERAFPDGQIRIGRKSYDGVGSLTMDSRGGWVRGGKASFFALLDEVSRVGEISPYLTEQWSETKLRFDRLTREGLIGST